MLKCLKMKKDRGKEQRNEGRRKRESEHQIWN
jgi:hypothetical protein